MKMKVQLNFQKKNKKKVKTGRAAEDLSIYHTKHKAEVHTVIPLLHTDLCSITTRTLNQLKLVILKKFFFKK